MGALHGAYRRSVPSRQTSRGAHAIVSAAKAHHGARAYAKQSPAICRLDAGADQAAAAEIGRNTAALVEIIMRERTHPEQGFRACMGITKLVKSYSSERVEAACERALQIGARSFTSVKSILKNNLETKRPKAATDVSAITHNNIRGPGYFH